MIALFTHAPAVGARPIGKGGVFALVNDEGDTIDVVSGDELKRMCEADDAALQEELGHE